MSWAKMSGLELSCDLNAMGLNYLRTEFDSHPNQKNLQNAKIVQRLLKIFDPSICANVIFMAFLGLVLNEERFDIHCTFF